MTSTNITLNHSFLPRGCVEGCFTPPPPLSGPTTKKNTSLCVCFPKHSEIHKGFVAVVKLSVSAVSLSDGVVIRWIGGIGRELYNIAF